MLELRVLLLLAALSSLLWPAGGLQPAAEISPAPMAGVAVYYSPRWDWSRIAQIQGVTLPAGRTPIAHWDCRTLGRNGWLALGDSIPFPVTVADCTATEDLPLVQSRRIVAEVPYQVAQRTPGMIGSGSAPAVLWLEPPRVLVPVPAPARLLPRIPSRLLPQPL